MGLVVVRPRFDPFHACLIDGRINLFLIPFRRDELGQLVGVENQLFHLFELLVYSLLQPSELGFFFLVVCDHIVNVCLNYIEVLQVVGLVLNYGLLNFDVQILEEI